MTGQGERMSDHYVDDNGVRRRRGSEDFASLPERHQAVVERVPGFEGDAELIAWMTHARAYYEYGLYRDALRYLILALERLPAFEPYLFYYVRVCKQVLAAALTPKEARFEKRVNRYLSLPTWLKYLLPKMKREVRCKWCGRYGPYVDPDTPTFGFDRFANSCGRGLAGLPRIGAAFCGRMYHMPTWLWDSPDGRAYSYYRMSFADDAFYEEFERDYDPDPRCKRRLTAPVQSSPFRGS